MVNDTPSPRGFFITIIAVIGGALLMSQFYVIFIAIAPLLLLLLTPLLLIYFAQLSKDHAGNNRIASTSEILSSFFKKYRTLFLITGLPLYIFFLISLCVQDNIFNSLVDHSAPVRSYIQKATSSEQEVRTSRYQRPNFETGVIFPRWSQDGYGPTDTEWQQGLSDISVQTSARWMEVTILFSQSLDTLPQVTTSNSTPTVDSIAEGIRAARMLGYHVFVVPLIKVDGPQGAWVGSIHFSTYRDEEQWFNSYWQVLQPYIVAAAQAGAEQVSIGTELEWLQQFAPVSLWNTLIARMHSVFPGMLTYDMNWSSLKKQLPSWMNNPQLAMLGVSEYLPLENVHARIEPKQIFALWRDIVKSALDAVAMHLDKPVLISEIGYRNSADALYQPWYPDSPTSPPDPEEQAAACNAALANVIPDPHIVGIFFWGWDQVERFKLAGQPAVTVLHKWYTSLQS